jgi:RimJ/RimL family protein N-acetyltransferase
VHQYIFGHDEVVARFVADLIPECRLRGFGKCRAIGIADAEGKLLGGLVYRNWCPEVGTIEISGAAVAGTNWLSRRTVQVMYDYPFYEVGCQMVIKTTMADNAIVLRIMAAIGFSLHKIHRLGGRYRDGVVGTLTVEDWEASRYNVNRRKPKEAIDARTTADASDGWHGVTSAQPAARPYRVSINEHRQSATADADAADAAA